METQTLYLFRLAPGASSLLAEKMQIRSLDATHLADSTDEIHRRGSEGATRPVGRPIRLTVAAVAVATVAVAAVAVAAVVAVVAPAAVGYSPGIRAEASASPRCRPVWICIGLRARLSAPLPV